MASNEDNEARIARLLEQLMSPNRSDAEIAQIERKIRFLKEQVE